MARSVTPGSRGPAIGRSARRPATNSRPLIGRAGPWTYTNTLRATHVLRTGPEYLRPSVPRSYVLLHVPTFRVYKRTHARTQASTHARTYARVRSPFSTSARPAFGFHVYTYVRTYISRPRSTVANLAHHRRRHQIHQPDHRTFFTGDPRVRCTRRDVGRLIDALDFTHRAASTSNDGGKKAGDPPSGGNSGQTIYFSFLFCSFFSFFFSFLSRGIGDTFHDFRIFRSGAARRI